MDITLAGIVLTLAVIAVRVILSHRDFKDQEYIYIFHRNTINVDTTENQDHMVTERPDKIRRKHQAIPKQAQTSEEFYHKNL